MADRFSGAITVITGGSSGIGKTCAKALAARGAKVYLLARSMKSWQKSSTKSERPGERPTAFPSM